MIKIKACKLKYHSGGMMGSYYFTTDEVDLGIYKIDKEQGVRGKIGPFLQVGEVCLTKEQATRLAAVISEVVAKMD